MQAKIITLPLKGQLEVSDLQAEEDQLEILRVLKGDEEDEMIINNYK